ncbi:MAG: dihydrolipoyl dehydrogenase, partial [Fidelibacterota bacterium]
VGGGPGGYVAAIRAAQLGKSVAIVERDALGGVCLNWGCIPTKSLLHDSEVLHTVKNADKHGIKISGFTVDFKATVKRSRQVAQRLSRGVEYLMKKNGVTHVKGSGRLKSREEVEVTGSSGETLVLQAGYIILATGARNLEIPGLQVDGKRTLSSREAMILEKVPGRMIIIGAGAIGVEFASFYHEYGTQVDLVEMLPTVLPQEDDDISMMLARLFDRRGIAVHTSTRVEKIDSLKTKVKVHVSSDGKSEILEGDVALVAVGVQGNVEALGLEEAGVTVEKGWIKVNEVCQTTKEGIYAIGDVIGPPWLAHVASAEGRVAVEHLSGKNPQPIDYHSIPACTYCQPQVASIGLTEKAALQAGHDINVGKFPMRASGRALASGESDGMVKIIFDAKYGELLGCHIIGSGATELIAEMGVAKTLETTHEEILRTIHAHPTLSEALMEAVAAAFGRPIHI